MDDKSVELSFYEAFNQAKNQGLDLVVISNGDVPVCKILDLGQYRYAKKKSERENAKKQREMAVDTKEIQLRPVTDENDIEIKARKAKAFLEEGDKVKIVVRFRGRERQHKDLGYGILQRFLALVGEHKVEKAFAENDDMSTVITPLLSKAEIKKAKSCQAE